MVAKEIRAKILVRFFFIGVVWIPCGEGNIRS
jgi:hypothetical protein